jgi:hypothetical protein
MADLDSRERTDLRVLVVDAERGSPDPQVIPQEATGRLDRRLVDLLLPTVRDGIEQVREVQFRHVGLDRDDRAPVAAVAALAWLRSTEWMLETGMEPQALAVLVAMFPARDEAGHTASG